jgi:hypothetical protein
MQDLIQAEYRKQHLNNITQQIDNIGVHCNRRQDIYHHHCHRIRRLHDMNVSVCLQHDIDTLHNNTDLHFINILIFFL